MFGVCFLLIILNTVTNKDWGRNFPARLTLPKTQGRLCEFSRLIAQNKTDSEMSKATGAILKKRGDTRESQHTDCFL